MNRNLQWYVHNVVFCLLFLHNNLRISHDICWFWMMGNTAVLTI